MQTNEWRELLGALEEVDRHSGGAANWKRLSETLNSLTLATVEGSPKSVLNDVQALAAAQPRTRSAEPATPQSKPSAAPTQAGDSATTAVLKTVGMVTGVGPIVTGLMKLFGGGGEPAEPAALPAYSLPNRISVEAGLNQDRTFSGISYGQAGLGRSVTPGAETTPAPAQIQVNVQAMDSRSFLDHSDDIARAVRDAMLRSHSLNDVVAEL